MAQAVEVRGPEKVFKNHSEAMGPMLGMPRGAVEGTGKPVREAFLNRSGRSACGVVGTERWEDVCHSDSASQCDPDPKTNAKGKSQGLVCVFEPMHT